MTRSGYRSFVDDDNFSSARSPEEAEMATLLPINTRDVTDVHQRDSRQRLVAIVSLILAIAGMSFLASLKNHSSKGSSVANMQSFTSPGLTSGQPTYAPALIATAKPIQEKTSMPLKGRRRPTKKPSNFPLMSVMPSAAPSTVRETAKPTAEPTVEPTVAVFTRTLAPSPAASAVPTHCTEPAEEAKLLEGRGKITSEPTRGTVTGHPNRSSAPSIAPVEKSSTPSAAKADAPAVALKSGQPTLAPVPALPTPTVTAKQI